MSKPMSLALTALPLLCGLLHAQAFEAKVQEPASNPVDRFGNQVLWHDDVLFVAEAGADLAGQVHVFKEQPQGWVELDTFAPEAVVPGVAFGGAMAADGDVLVVGSRSGQWTGEPISGGAWIFVRERMGTGTPLDDRWTELQALQPTDPAPPPDYGWSVAIFRDRVLVGAPAAGLGGFSAVYVFARDDGGTPSPLDDTWTQQARLDPSPLTPASRLGVCVAFTDGGQLALASDPLDREGSEGGVLTWTRDTHGTIDPLDDTWSAGPQIEAPADAALDETFVVDGQRLFAQGNHPDPDIGMGIMECVDVFERDAGAWSLAQVLDNPASMEYGFGWRLAAEGDWLVSGDLGFEFPTGFGADSMVFHRVGEVWTHVQTLRAPDQAMGDGFGWAASIDGSRVFLGAPGRNWDDDWQPVEGAVYVLVLDATEGWTRIGAEHADLQLGGWGLLDGAHPVTVRAYDNWGPEPALLVIGFSLLDAPLSGHVLVPQPDVLVPVALGPGGDVQFTGHWPAGLADGFSLWFQVWMPQTGWWPWAASNGLRATQPAP